MTKVVRIPLKQLTAAKEDTKKLDQDIVFDGGVNKLNDKGKGTKPRILILTKQYVCYYRLENKATIDRQHYWNHIKSFESKGLEIDLEFETEEKDKSTFIRFTTKDHEEIQSKIFDILSHVLSQDELTPLNLKRFTMPKYSVNGLGILQRYESILKQDNKKSSKAIKKQLLEYLPTYNKIFRLKVDSNLGDLLSSLCNTLKPYTALESLYIPKVESSSFYKDLSESLVTNFPVKHISIANQPDHQFVAFTDGTKASAIEGLSFEDITLSEENFVVLADAVLHLKKFRSISFKGVIKSSSFDFFTSQFLTGYVRQRIQMLCVDRTPGIDVSQIINELPVINSLSFAECDLDIAPTLSTIGGAHLTNLRYLNLSGNHATTPFSREIDVPRQLIRFDVNNVAWGNDVLPSFLKFIVTRRFSKGIRLYVSNATVGPNDWNQVDTELAGATNFSILELGWNGNPVSPAFVDFLKRNKLQTLFVNGCFDKGEADENNYKNFCSSLEDFTYLRNLVIRGTEGKFLGIGIIPLLKALETHPKINHLDISNQQMGVSGFSALESLVEKALSLSTLIVDNNNFEKLEVFNSLLQSATNRGKAISIQYPLAEISKGVEDKTFPKKDVEKLVQKLESLRTARASAGPRRAGILGTQTFKRVRSGTFRSVQKGAAPKKGSQRFVKDVKDGADGSGAPETVFKKPFDYFISEFTDEFPDYINETLAREFSLNFNRMKAVGEKSSRHKHHRRTQERGAILELDEDEEDEPEWVEEEEIPEPEEEDQPETPLQKRCRTLYGKMGYQPPDWKSLVKYVEEPKGARFETQLKSKAELTPILNNLVQNS